MSIRYNSGQIASRRVERLANKHIPRLGRLHSIEGKRVVSGFGVLAVASKEIVVVHGENGTAIFGGVSWGYGGEGPHALVSLLVAAGFTKEAANTIAFATTRQDTVGSDWKYDFHNHHFTTRQITPVAPGAWQRKVSPAKDCETADRWGYGT